MSDQLITQMQDDVEDVSLSLEGCEGIKEIVEVKCLSNIDTFVIWLAPKPDTTGATSTVIAPSLATDDDKPSETKRKPKKRGLKAQRRPLYDDLVSLDFGKSSTYDLM